MDGLRNGWMDGWMDVNKPSVCGLDSSSQFIDFSFFLCVHGQILSACLFSDDRKMVMT